MNFSRYFTFPLSVCLLMAVFTTFSAAQTESVLFSFNGTNGAYPFGRVLFDSTGNLYGVTQAGGDLNCEELAEPGCGTVFELHSEGGAWQEKQVHLFSEAHFDGGIPSGGVTLDSMGSVYGATEFGGGAGSCGGKGVGCGSVYELSHSHSGWQEQILYGFGGSVTGSDPMGELAFDPKGNLYGVTCCSGGNKVGLVFELTPAAGRRWTETVLYAFTGGNDGGLPEAGLLIDMQGNIYGTTVGGGARSCPGGCGVVFELSPPAVEGDPWTETVLYTFAGGSDGAFPRGQLVFDSDGALYGTTEQGGSVGSHDPPSFVCCGTVFKLSPPVRAGGAWAKTVIYSFSGNTDGEEPMAGVVFDNFGNLYGTTMFGGAGSTCFEGCGTVFELKPTSSGWSESILHAFDGKDGSLPLGPVTLDSLGNVYGVTYGGGTNLYGAVFEITP
jgi:hypothetical protein